MDERIKEDVKLVINSDILIDSCVLIYCGDNKHKDFSKKLLRLLANNGNKLAISEFSGFEVIKNYQNKDNFDYYLNLINFVENREVTRGILIIAATLHKHYNKRYNAHDNEGCMQAGDLIIGATSAEKQTLLLTSDVEDFPEPSWKIIAQTYNVYNDGRKKKILNYYLLKFDASVVQESDLRERLKLYIN